MKSAARLCSLRLKALQKETDAAGQEKLASIRKEKEGLQAQQKELQAQWDSEKQAILRVRGIKKEMDNVRSQMESAERDYDPVSYTHLTLPTICSV